MVGRYLMQVWDGVEPLLLGPFDSDRDRDQAAIQLRGESEDDGLYPLDVDWGTGQVDTWTFGEGLLQGDPDFLPDYDEAGNYREP